MRCGQEYCAGPLETAWVRWNAGHQNPILNTMSLTRLSTVANAPILTPFTGDEQADRLRTTDGPALLTGMLLDQRLRWTNSRAGPPGLIVHPTNGRIMA